jgi:hypothetical protein
MGSVWVEPGVNSKDKSNCLWSEVMIITDQAFIAAISSASSLLQDLGADSAVYHSGINRADKFVILA